MLTRTFWVLVAATFGALLMLSLTRPPARTAPAAQVVVIYDCGLPIEAIYSFRRHLHTVSWSRLQSDASQRDIVSSAAEWQRVDLACSRLAPRAQLEIYRK